MGSMFPVAPMMVQFSWLGTINAFKLGNAFILNRLIAAPVSMSTGTSVS